MKHAFRALFLLLVFLLVTSASAMAVAPELMPMEGLAPELMGSLLEVTLDNVKVGVMDAEPTDIGVSARVLAGADGERYLALGELSGAIGKALSYAMCFEDGAYRVRMQNLSNDYTLSEAALNALDPAERPIDYPLVPPVLPKDVPALLAAYERLAAAQGADYLKTPSYELTAFRKLGIDQPGSTKRVNVLGENLELMFFEAALDAQAMDDWDATMGMAAPEVQAAQAEIDAIMEKYTTRLPFVPPPPEWETSPDWEPTPMPMPTPVPSPLPTPTPTPVPTPEPSPTPDGPDGYVKRGEHVEAKYRLWSDETASNTRSEKEVLTASGEGDKRVERRTSTVWEQRVSPTSCLDKKRMVSTGKNDSSTMEQHSEYHDDGGVVRYSDERDNASHYDYGDFKVDTKDHTATSYTINPDGTHEAKVEWYMLSYGQKIDALFEVEGGPDGDDALRSHVTLIVKANQQDEEGGDERQIFALSASFDVHARLTPLPEGKLATLLGMEDGAEALELSKLTADQKKALETEMSTAMIVASGTMMATPGVAKLIADVQTAMTKVYQDMFDRYAVEDVQSDL